MFSCARCNRTLRSSGIHRNHASESLRLDQLTAPEGRLTVPLKTEEICNQIGRKRTKRDLHILKRLVPVAEHVLEGFFRVAKLRLQVGVIFAKNIKVLKPAVRRKRVQRFVVQRCHKLSRELFRWISGWLD